MAKREVKVVLVPGLGLWAGCSKRSSTVANNQEAATITIGGTPTGVAMVRSGQYVYVSQVSGNALTVLSTVSRSQVATVPGVGNRPLGLALTPSGEYVYVAANGSNRVYGVYTNGF